MYTHKKDDKYIILLWQQPQNNQNNGLSIRDNNDNIDNNSGEEE